MSRPGQEESENVAMPDRLGPSGELVAATSHQSTVHRHGDRDDRARVRREVAEAVDLLPGLPPPNPDERYHSRTLTVLWLLDKSPTSRRGYYQTLADWLAWCSRCGLDPMRARKADVDAWKAQMIARRQGPNGTWTEGPPSRATIAKRLAVLTSWYDYQLDNQSDNEVTIRNPAARVNRPQVSRKSTTAALSVEQTAQLIDFVADRAERLGTESAWRDAALITLVFTVAVRISSALGAEVKGLQRRSGIRVLRYPRKSRGEVDDWGEEVLPPLVWDMLHRYLQLRAERESREQGRPITVAELDGPLFVSTPDPWQPDYAGGSALRQNKADDKIRDLARQAGLDPSVISMHVGRHTAGTVALQHGAAARDVQRMLDHANLATTERYLHDLHDLQNSAVWTVAEAITAARAARAADPNGGRES